MKPAAFEPYAWESSMLWAAEVDAAGVIRRANPSLGRARRDPVVGLPVTDLVAAAQRPALAARLADPPADWVGITVAVPEPGETMAGDRRMWLRAGGDGTVLVVMESGRGPLSDPVAGELLRLMDDMAAEQRQIAADREELREARRQAVERAERLRRLEAVATAGLSGAGLEDLLPDLLAAVVFALSCDRAAILLQEGDHLVVRAAVGLDASAGAAERVPIGSGVAGRIAAGRRSLIVSELSEADVADSPQLGRRGGALAGVPLRVGEDAMGVLLVSNDEPRRLADDVLGLLHPVAERVAVAITRAQLYEREHRIAQVLQRALLPERLPEVDGLRLVSRLRAGGEGSDVGGDWYDAIPVAGGQIALALGDVAGKGIGAAALMGMFRSALRAFAIDGGEPREVLERLDRIARRSNELATVLLAHVSAATGSVLYASAGHLPPLLVEPGRPPRFLEDGRSGPLLAFGSGEHGRAELAPGAILLLYSDGLVERRGEVIDDGLAALLDAARGAAHGAEVLCDQVLERMLGSREAADDVTLLAVERA